MDRPRAQGLSPGFRKKAVGANTHVEPTSGASSVTQMSSGVRPGSPRVSHDGLLLRIA